MLSGRGLCDELITRAEESYRLCCVIVCDLETSRMGAAYIYIYDISRLRVKRVFSLLKEVKYYVTEGIILLFYNQLFVTSYNCETGPSKLWISIYMCYQLSVMLQSHDSQN